MCIFCVLERIFFATELIIINKCYRLAGQDFHFPWPIPELEAFEKLDPKQSLSVSKSMFINESSDTFSIPAPEAVSIQTTGWVANAQRQVEVIGTGRGRFDDIYHRLLTVSWRRSRSWLG